MAEGAHGPGRTLNAGAAERAAQMARSVESALHGRGVPEATTRTVLAAYALAMEPRLATEPLLAGLEDDHHPALLHPGRSVLILLHDVEPLEADALATAALHESADPALRVSAERVRDGLAARVDDPLAGQLARRLDALPLPGDPALEERLVLLDRASGLAVLAERLDQLRHLHLRAETAPDWPWIHEEVERAWRPFASRTDARLAGRYDHWSRTFARRLRRAQFPRV